MSEERADIADSSGHGNRLTVTAYEDYAIQYAHSTQPANAVLSTPGLSVLVPLLPAGAQCLEIGSGPGWDADILEGMGLQLRRTDATRAFVDFQADRGKSAELLDVVNDELAGPYDVVIAFYVFQHIDRDLLPGVIAKCAAALKEGGYLLFSISHGAGDETERSSAGRLYYKARWQRSDLVEMFEPLGLAICWETRDEDDEGPWLFFLLSKGRPDVG